MALKRPLGVPQMTLIAPHCSLPNMGIKGAFNTLSFDYMSAGYPRPRRVRYNGSF
jgi:hypothetical protein